jgi:cytochrome c oxidase subunit IV
MGNLSLYSWGNGSFIMIVVFGLVIIGLIAAVFMMMNSDKKKK